MTTPTAPPNEPTAADPPAAEAPTDNSSADASQALPDSPPPTGDADPIVISDADVESPEPKVAKSDAAKRGHETRQKRAKRRSELADDPDVRLLLDQARLAGEATAKESAAEEAKRSSMSELERAQAEAADAKAKVESMATELKGQMLEREYSDAVVDSELKIRAKSRKIVRSLVAEAMAADTSLAVPDALHVVLEEHSYLRQPDATPAASHEVPQSKRPGATTTPAPKRETAAPAATEPDKPFDVSNLSRQEFIKHARENHGINVQF